MDEYLRVFLFLCYMLHLDTFIFFCCYVFLDCITYIYIFFFIVLAYINFSALQG